jgi:hypothetical protein
MRGMMLNLEVEMVLMLGMMKMVLEMWWRCSPLHQGGVDGVDAGDFSPAAVADRPFRRWKKGSTSTATSENYRENRMSLFYEMKAYKRRRRRGDHRGPNGPRWRGQSGRPRHLFSFGPRGSPRVLPPLQVLLVIKY